MGRPLYLRGKEWRCSPSGPLTGSGHFWGQKISFVYQESNPPSQQTHSQISMFILNPFHTLGPPSVMRIMKTPCSIAERRFVVKGSDSLNGPYTVKRLRITYHSKCHKLEHVYRLQYAVSAIAMGSYTGEIISVNWLCYFTTRYQLEILCGVTCTWKCIYEIC